MAIASKREDSRRTNAPPAPVPEKLAEIAKEIAEDARRDPRQYQEDTRVPAGGE